MEYVSLCLMCTWFVVKENGLSMETAAEEVPKGCGMCIVNHPTPVENNAEQERHGKVLTHTQACKQTQRSHTNQRGWCSKEILN